MKWFLFFLTVEKVNVAFSDNKPGNKAKNREKKPSFFNLKGDWIIKI